MRLTKPCSSKQVLHRILWWRNAFHGNKSGISIKRLGHLVKRGLHTIEDIWNTKSQGWVHCANLLQDLNEEVVIWDCLKLDLNMWWDSSLGSPIHPWCCSYHCLWLPYTWCLLQNCQVFHGILLLDIDWSSRVFSFQRRYIDMWCLDGPYLW